MLAARLLLRKGGIKPFLSGKQTFEETTRLFRSQGNYLAKAKSIAKSQTIKEKLMAPTTGIPISFYKGVAAGASLCAIGGLCYYDLGLSNEGRTFNSHVYWPHIFRDRIRTTYEYFGGGVLITTASVVAAFRSKTFINFVLKSPLQSIGGLGVGAIASMLTCFFLTYREGFGAKQAAFTVFSVLQGLFVVPLLAIFRGPLLIRAACYTAAILGGLSTLAVCAPSEKFLYMGAPLCMGLGVVFAASLGSLFLPATTATGLSSISLYGGLVLFGGFVLYDTQRVIRGAQRTDYERHGPTGYDPINMAINLYLDSVNIFSRIVSILSGINKK